MHLSKSLKAVLRTPFAWIMLVIVLMMVSSFAPEIANWASRGGDNPVADWSILHWWGIAVGFWTLYVMAQVGGLASGDRIVAKAQARGEKTREQ